MEFRAHAAWLTALLAAALVRSDDEPHSRQKRILWITNDGRLALPPGTALVITPSLSMPFVRYPPDGFLSNMTISLPFTSMWSRPNSKTRIGISKARRRIKWQATEYLIRQNVLLRDLKILFIRYFTASTGFTTRNLSKYRTLIPSTLSAHLHGFLAAIFKQYTY